MTILQQYNSSEGRVRQWRQVPSRPRAAEEGAEHQEPPKVRGKRELRQPPTEGRDPAPTSPIGNNGGTVEIHATNFAPQIQSLMKSVTNTPILVW